MNISPIIELDKTRRPLLIAGPCSAESREQVLITAQQLAQTQKIDLFRCGVWKPRSSPNSFEGIGIKALQWLKEVKEKYHIIPCIEIATPEHLESALKYDIDIFWIGARTSVNPFMVQELAQASKGLNIGIMIKNPIALDLHLWYGNFERFANAGITRLAAIFRGCSTEKNQVYRNDPAWLQLIDFKQHHKEIPIIFDPSHIAGNKQYIHQLAQKALYLDIDGLMIETHYQPENALSDKNQQITIEQYIELINSLTFPNQSTNTDSQLTKYRLSIDEIDNALITLISQRLHIAEQIADYKKKHNLPILQIERWQQVLEDCTTKAKELQIDPQVVTEIMQSLHNASIKKQEETIAPAQH